MTTVDNNIASRCYDLSYIYGLKNNGFNYEIPERTMYIINKISGQVGAPTYSRTPIFKKKIHNDNTGINEPFKNKNISNNIIDDVGFKTINKKKKPHKKNNNRIIQDDEWGNIRNFETTKIEKNEEGVEKELNKIRIQLNKLTKKTFIDVNMVLNDIIDNFMNSSDINENDMFKISNMIFDVASSNGFHANQYALLYKGLMNKYEALKNVFKRQYEDVIKQLTNIKNANADEDYDNFCVVNAENQNNKSVAKFMSYMYIEDVITTSDISGLLDEIITIFITNLELKNVSFICEQVSDILFEIIQIINSELIVNNKEYHDTLTEKIDKLSNLNKNEYPSFTNKIKFKLMDIVEIMEED